MHASILRIPLNNFDDRLREPVPPFAIHDGWSGNEPDKTVPRE